MDGIAVTLEEAVRDNDGHGLLPWERMVLPVQYHTNVYPAKTPI
jgi:hypothetical protein